MMPNDSNHETLHWHRPDPPRNVAISYDQRNGVILPHDLDVVCLVKRNAADHTLAQDSLSKQHISEQC